MQSGLGFWVVFIAFSVIQCQGEELSVEELLDGHHKPLTESASLNDDKKRLDKIVKSIDSNKDGFISMEELKHHLEKTLRTLDEETAEQAFASIRHANNSFITLNEYFDDLYQIAPEKVSQLTPDNLRKAADRDLRLFKAADLNHDGQLNKTEYCYFVHPDNYEWMADFHAEQMREEMDINKDGKISLEEFVKMHQEAPSVTIDYELQLFNRHDLNGDGFLDLDEMKLWLKPNVAATIDSAAQKLFSICDTNKDKLLSEREIFDNIEAWRDHEATNFGDMIQHDEL